MPYVFNYVINFELVTNLVTAWKLLITSQTILVAFAAISVAISSSGIGGIVEPSILSWPIIALLFSAVSNKPPALYPRTSRGEQQIPLWRRRRNDRQPMACQPTCSCPRYRSSIHLDPQLHCTLQSAVRTTAASDSTSYLSIPDELCHHDCCWWHGN